MKQHVGARGIMGFKLAFAIAAVLSIATTAAQASVVDLTESTFDRETSENVWMIKFYAPWCGHCKKLAPIFDQLASQADLVKAGNVRVAKVDCTVERSICDRFSIQSYPTLKLVDGGRSYDYGGRREVDVMAEYAISGYKGTASEPVLTLEQMVKQRQTAKKEQDEAERLSSVVTITSKTFESVVKESNHPWILKFYAPWCGHCKRLTPTWHRLSRALEEGKSTTKVGKVDCTVHRRVCSRFGVNGYPTLMYVNEGNVYKYQGGRNLNSFLDYVNDGWKKAENTGPIPDETLLATIVDSAVEWAAEHTVLAIVAGILFIAIFVAVLVALLDYCLAEDNEIETYRQVPRAPGAVAGSAAAPSSAPPANKPKAE